MTTIARAFSAILVTGVATGLGAMSLAADSPPKPAAAPPPPAAAGMAGHQDMAQHHKDMIQRRLDSAASRLEIKASQQQAWQAFAAAVQALGDNAGAAARPAADADASTIAHDRAARATVFARKLTTIADATERLQGVLTPEQKGVLAQLTRDAGMHQRMMEGQRGEGRRPMGREQDDRDSMDHAPMDRGAMDHAN